MASQIRETPRSFINTLFYAWNVLKAFFSFHSISSSHFREAVIVVPYPIDIDLESGSHAGSALRDTIALPVPPPPAFVRSPRSAIRRTIDDDSRWQERLRSSPAFTSSMTSSNTVLLSSNKHSDHSTLTKIPTGEHERRLHNVSPPPAKNHIPDKWEAAPIDAALHTSLEAGTSTLLPFNDRGNKQQRNDSDVEAFVPFCTSTPPSTPQRGEGHKRTAPTITDVVKLDIFKAHAKFMPSPTVTPEATIELPLVLKPHSPSLKRKSAHSDLQSPSTLQHSLDSITASPFGVRTKLSQMPIMKPVSPLRIVKRHSPKPVGVRASTTSEVSKSVISAVRDAFVEARDADADEEGTTVRELINRDSVWTCDGPHGGPTRYNMSMLLEGDESDEEHGRELPTIRATPCTPPPPYAFRSPGPGVLFGSEKEGELMPSVFSGIVTPQVTELLRLETTSLSSVDSCLDDIIVSFEHLMTIVPNLNSPLLQDPLLSAKGSDKNTADARILANGNITSRCSALSEAYGGCVSQWSDVLRLDSY